MLKHLHSGKDKLIHYVDFTPNIGSCALFVAAHPPLIFGCVTHTLYVTTADACLCMASITPSSIQVESYAFHCSYSCCVEPLTSKPPSSSFKPSNGYSRGTCMQQKSQECNETRCNHAAVHACTVRAVHSTRLTYGILAALLL